jgi:uncharacterized protein (DUF305 family)
MKRLSIVITALVLATLLLHNTSFGAPATTTPDQQMMAAMDKMHQAMTKMKMSGDADMDFAMMMIPHHQAAIDMAKVELKYGKDAQMRKMAQKIIADQQKEIAQMKSWMKAKGMNH